MATARGVEGVGEWPRSWVFCGSVNVCEWEAGGESVRLRPRKSAAFREGG